MRRMEPIRCEHEAARTDPWQALANAIVLQTARDYRQARKTVNSIQKRVHNGRPVKPEEAGRLRQHYSSAKREIRQDEQFFESAWFGVLTTVDGTELLRKLRKEAV